MTLHITTETELIEALKTVTVHLIAAHSLLKAGGKKAAPSDKMFYMMLEDYEKAINLGRETLANHPKGYDHD